MMLDARRSAWLFGALLLVGCGEKKSESVPAASSAPAAAAANAKPAPVEHAAPTEYQLKPATVGQWLRMISKAPAEPPSQLFLRVIGKEGEAFWYEIESNTPSGTTVIQFLMDEAGRKSFSKNAIKKLRVKSGLEPVKEYSDPMLAMAGSIVETYVGLFAQPSNDKASRADALVPAGNFKGCFVHELEHEVMGDKVRTKSWRHSDVPVVGFVRSEASVGGKNVVTELLEMHEDGAMSAL